MWEADSSFFIVGGPSWPRTCYPWSRMSLSAATCSIRRAPVSSPWNGPKRWSCLHRGVPCRQYRLLPVIVRQAATSPYRRGRSLRKRRLGPRGNHSQGKSATRSSTRECTIAAAVIRVMPIDPSRWPDCLRASREDSRTAAPQVHANLTGTANGADFVSAVIVCRHLPFSAAKRAAHNPGVVAASLFGEPGTNNPGCAGRRELEHSLVSDRRES